MDRDLNSDNHNIYNHFLTLVGSNISQNFMNQNMDQGYMLQPFFNGNPNFKEEIFQYLIAEFINGRLKYDANNFEANQRLSNSDTSEHDVQTNFYDNYMANNNTQPMPKATSQLTSDKIIDKNKQLDQDTVTMPKMQGKSIPMVQHTTTNGTKVFKQKRAKRGQYRKYETEQLHRAMNAVLNGSMSVHKAGSRFGVPHSTLEYKVKEKHGSAFSSSTNSRSSSSDNIKTETF